MRNVPNSVDTVNAAANAIVTAETRVQPSAVQSRRWGNCWSIYWCFGSIRQRKRIGHAVLVSEPDVPRIVAPVVENRSHISTILLPFIAPPSSPTSFLQSDPSSATQSPAAMPCLKSLSVNTPSIDGTTIFTVGPYAHESQLVSPPVFSAFTTEPSTASFTPPPEPVQTTTPSSPEVPFAQLLSSSLAQNGRHGEVSLKYSLAQYEFKPYQYPGSPSAYVKSPNSVISTSGTSSPLPDRPRSIEFRMGDPPKVLRYEDFLNYRWDSKVCSGSMTPQSGGWGSGVASGNLTPNGRLSKLGSGTMTPNGGDGNQVVEASSFPSSGYVLQNDEAIIDPRLSFELLGEDIPTCVIRAAEEDSYNHVSSSANKSTNAGTLSQHLCGESLNIQRTQSEEGDDSHEKHRTISFGSSKEFHFNNTNEEASEKECEWWTKDKSQKNNWSFFSMLQSSAT